MHCIMGWSCGHNLSRSCPAQPDAHSAEGVSPRPPQPVASEATLPFKTVHYGRVNILLARLTKISD